MSITRLARTIALGLVTVMTLVTAGDALSDEPVRYLAFQIFTSNPGPNGVMTHPVPSDELRAKVIDIRNRIGIIKAGKR
ncbi:MAG: hypothetical protein ACREDV_05645, partial [Methylocella sp.]